MNRGALRRRRRGCCNRTLREVPQNVRLGHPTADAGSLNRRQILHSVLLRNAPNERGVACRSTPRFRRCSRIPRRYRRFRNRRYSSRRRSRNPSSSRIPRRYRRFRNRRYRSRRRSRSRSCSRSRRRSRCSHIRFNPGDDLSDFDGLAHLSHDLHQDAALRAGDLGVDLVGLDGEDVFVALHNVADLLVPGDDGAFDDRLAHLGHDDFYAHGSCSRVGTGRFASIRR